MFLHVFWERFLEEIFKINLVKFQNQKTIVSKNELLFCKKSKNSPVSTYLPRRRAIYTHYSTAGVIPSVTQLTINGIVPAFRNDA